MEQKGLIERKNVKGDARLKKIVMTDKARELHMLMKNDVIMLESILRSGLSNEEIETFYNLTKKIKNNLHKYINNINKYENDKEFFKGIR
jgi:DNA-binding MarR family transcriptional regulator